jgi:hypothetical protein
MSTPADRPIVVTRDNYLLTGQDKVTRMQANDERYTRAIVIEADWGDPDEEVHQRLVWLQEILQAQEDNEDGQHRSRAPGGGPG